MVVSPLSPTGSNIASPHARQQRNPSKRRMSPWRHIRFAADIVKLQSLVPISTSRTQKINVGGILAQVSNDCIPRILPFQTGEAASVLFIDPTIALKYHKGMGRIFHHLSAVRLSRSTHMVSHNMGRKLYRTFFVTRHALHALALYCIVQTKVAYSQFHIVLQNSQQPPLLMAQHQSYPS